MKLKSIKECGSGHCEFHFPQFNYFTEEMLHGEIERVLLASNDPTSYFRKSYPNWNYLSEEYKKIKDMEFIDACEYLMELQQKETSYIRHDLYLTLQGQVAVFEPCCK